jgi:hypothetical protein
MFIKTKVVSSKQGLQRERESDETRPPARSRDCSAPASICRLEGGGTARFGLARTAGVLGKWRNLGIRWASDNGSG